MLKHSYKNYFDDDVLAASPLKLVELLYRGALDAVADARRHLRQRDIRARSQAVSKAMAIVTQLSLSLDRAQGGDLSRRLEQIYGYVLRLLMKANAEQSEGPLLEAEKLLGTLREAWTNCEQNQRESAVYESAECA